MERFSKTMTGAVLALGMVLGAATSASAFNPQPDPPKTAGIHDPSALPGYSKPSKPAEFKRVRNVPQVVTPINKPRAKK